MTDDLSQWVDEFSHYVQDAIVLRQSIVFNEFDAQIPENDEKKHIVYLFDADIVHMFMHPANNTRYVDVFELESEESRNENKDNKQDDQIRVRGVLMAGAAVCAEFLFSGQLRSQGPQRKGYVASDHDNEIQNFARRLREREKDWNRAEATFVDKITAITAPMRLNAELYQAGKLSARDYVKGVHEQMPKLLSEWPLSSSHAISQLKRIVRNDLYLAAESLPAWNDEILFPPEEHVRNWYQRIIESKRKELQTKRRGRKTLSQREIEYDMNYLNLYRDARVIAQIEALNRMPGNDVIYTFVTGARSLHITFAEWRNSPAATGLSERKVAFLRHPRQYMPLINVGNTSYDADGSSIQSSKAKELVSLLKNALDSLLNLYFSPMELPSIASPERAPRFDQIKANVGKRAKGASEREIAGDEDKIREIRGKWLEIIEDSTFYHTSLLEDICRPALAPIAAASKSEEVRELIRAHIGKGLEAVEIEHARWGQATALLRMFAASPRGIPRSQAYVCHPFPGIAPEIFPDINTFLRTFAAGSDRDKLIEIVRNTKIEPGYLAHFFLGYFCLQTSLFSQAIYYLERSRQLIRKADDASPDTLYEVTYCLAVAIRHHELSGSEYERAAKFLGVSTHYHAEQFAKLRYQSELPTHHFRYLRDCSEAAALRVSYLTKRSAAHYKNGVPKADYEFAKHPDGFVEGQAEEALKQARGLLAIAEPKPHEVERYEQISLRLSAMRCGMLIYRSVFARKDFVVPEKEEAYAAIGELQKKLDESISHDEQPHFIMQINLYVLKWLVEPLGTRARHEAAVALDSYLTAEKTEKASSGLTIVDTQELDITGDRLRAELTTEIFDS